MLSHACVHLCIWRCHDGRNQKPHKRCFFCILKRIIKSKFKKLFTLNLLHFIFALYLIPCFGIRYRARVGILFAKSMSESILCLKGQKFSVWTTLSLTRTRAAIGSVQMTGCGFVPIKSYLWTLKFEFHAIYFITKCPSFWSPLPSHLKI